jgi:ubiquinone/menaquinone biosynthesis C-methylase UbiE
MKVHNLKYYRCPITGEELELDKSSVIIDGKVIEGVLLSKKSKKKYLIKDGVPDFTIYNDKEKEKNEYALNLFKEKAREYDKYLHLSFETFYEDETVVRNSMIDKLNLNADSHVLEVNAGTGRDSILILKRLSKKGFLNVQDISREMLDVCKTKIQNTPVPIEIHQGDACKLPYADKTFDALYSFGGVGMNTYANNKDAIAEMVRVTKINGKIVFGGLSLAPWLKNTFFGKVLMNYNNHYANEISFNDFPIQARNLNINWILAGAGFVIDFNVGEGDPRANFDFEIPGPRGGTHLTRYLGNLEGVTPETKKLALRAREKLGVSMHKWLDDLIKREAEKILKEKENK